MPHLESKKDISHMLDFHFNLSDGVLGFWGFGVFLHTL